MNSINLLLYGIYISDNADYVNCFCISYIRFLQAFYLEKDTFNTDLKYKTDISNRMLTIRKPESLMICSSYRKPSSIKTAVTTLNKKYIFFITHLLINLL